MDATFPEPAAESLSGPFMMALALHFAIFAGLTLLTYYANRNSFDAGWGSEGGSMTVGLVGSVPAVPMPRPDVVTESRVVDETKGLYKSEPPPKPVVEKEAIPLPKFEKNKPQPKYNSKPSRLLENPKPPPPNAVPYGGGGSPNVPYSPPSATMTLGSATQGGMSFNGSGNGNFGSRYGWYVDAVNRRISSNWLQATVDPQIQFAPRVDVTFQVQRDGTVTNIQVLKSSGNASVDTSAVRAIRASSPLQQLPGDYSGSYVNVDFWFEYRRQ
jgi:periplasmic protein TonB